jgi:hypothetical protein
MSPDCHARPCPVPVVEAAEGVSLTIHLGVIDGCNISHVAAERLVTIVAAIVVLWSIGWASLAITLPPDFWVTRAEDKKPSSSSSPRS